MPENLENSAVATGLEKVVFIPIPKQGNGKEFSNYRTIALISHASKVMLKILQARLQQYMNHELSDVQAGFRKGRGIRDQIANIHWIMENKGKQRRECLQLSAPPSSQAWSPPLPLDLDAWSPILSLRFPWRPPSTCSPVSTPSNLVKDSNSLIISSLSYIIYFFLYTGSFPSAHKHAQRPPENKRKTQRKACFDPAFPSSADSPTDLLPFPSRFFQRGPLSLTPCSPLKPLESDVDSRQMLKSRASSALSPLGSEPHPQSNSCHFLFSALLFGNHASLSFLRPLGWLFLIPLEWVSTVSLTHNISASPALVPYSPPSIQPLGEHLQACTFPYRSTQRHLSVHPQLWPSASTPTHGYTTSYRLFPAECQRAIWNAKLRSSFLLLSPGSQPCFCSSVFALVWNSISPGIHWDCFLYSRLLRKHCFNWEAFPNGPT